MFPRNAETGKFNVDSDGVDDFLGNSFVFVSLMMIGAGVGNILTGKYREGIRMQLAATLTLILGGVIRAID